MSQQITEFDMAAAAEATKALQRAYNEREQTKKNLAKVRALGGQQGYRVTMDSRTNMAKVIRGLVGTLTLKALEAQVDAWEAHVAACEQRLASLTSGKGGAA